MSTIFRTVRIVTIAATLVFLRVSIDSRPVQGEAEIPTRETKKTDRQKEHGKLFQQEDRRENLRDLTTKLQSDIVVREHVQRIIPEFGSSSANVLREKVCMADAVIVAKMGLRKSFFTDDETFVFSEHNANVEDILKDNPNSPIDLNSDIVVVRPGGLVLLSNGYTVGVGGSSFENIKAGRRCILFLRFISSAGSYKLDSSAFAFLLNDGKVVNSDQYLSSYFNGLNMNQQMFIQDIRNYAIR